MFVCYPEPALKQLSVPGFGNDPDVTLANCLSLSRLVVPNKGYSSLDQSPDEKPLVALDTDRYVTRILTLTATCQESLVILVDSLSLCIPRSPPPVMTTLTCPDTPHRDTPRLR